MGRRAKRVLALEVRAQLVLDDLKQATHALEDANRRVREVANEERAELEQREDLHGID